MRTFALSALRIRPSPLCFAEIEADIRFEAVAYSVIETDGTVEVVIIADFERQEPSNQRIDITFSTVDDSATGRRGHHLQS